MDSEIPIDYRASYYGPEDAKLLMIGWGFTKGAALEAIEKMKENVSCAYLHLKMFSPFPTEHVKGLLEKFDPKNIVAVEQNYLAQASKIITQHTGVKVEKAILKYTGRPIYVNELTKALEKVLGGERRVVLEYGA
jgi:2-oxoglutarate ferredoxin oxidoreductase subunit alpha